MIFRNDVRQHYYVEELWKYMAIGKRENKYIVNGPKYMLTNVECMIKDCLGRTDFSEYILYFKEFFVMW